MNKTEKDFDKLGLRIKSSIPYEDCILVEAEAKDGSKLSSPLYVYGPKSLFKTMISQFFPADHLVEFGEIIECLEEAKRNGNPTAIS